MARLSERGQRWGGGAVTGRRREETGGGSGNEARARWGRANSMLKPSCSLWQRSKGRDGADGSDPCRPCGVVHLGERAPANQRRASADSLSHGFDLA